MTLESYFQSLSISAESTISCAFHSISKNLITYPVNAYDYELILVLLGTDPSKIRDDHRAIIYDYMKNYTVKRSYCSRTNEKLFEQEYYGLWDSLLEISLDYNIDNRNEVRVLLIEHDAEIPLNTFLNEYNNLECIFLVTRISGKLELNCLFKKADGLFVDLKGVNSGEIKLHNSDQARSQRLSKLIYYRELFDKEPSWKGVLPVNHNSCDDNIFENEHWNRAFRGQFRGRDSLIYQFYDFLGNRTLEGFNGNQDINSGIVLTGGSSVWCREQPFSWGLEGNLRKMLNSHFQISNLAGCGETLTEEVQKIQHYIKYKGVPKAIVSYTGFNDINAIQYSESNLEHRRQNTVGFFSREHNIKYSHATLTNFIKRIHFDLKVLNYLASEYQYKHYIFLQPSLFSSNSQYELLMNSKTRLASIDQLSKMRNEAMPALYLSWLQNLFANHSYSNLELIDWTHLFDKCDDLMFYDWVHLSKAGCAKVAKAISEFINE